MGDISARIPPSIYRWIVWGKNFFREIYSTPLPSAPKESLLLIPIAVFLVLTAAATMTLEVEPDAPTESVFRMQDDDPSGYLLFIPQYQFNNQRIELLHAFAMAQILNRTLVLPYSSYKVGYKEDLHSWSHHVYVPFTRYFDGTKMDEAHRNVDFGLFVETFGRHFPDIYYLGSNDHIARFHELGLTYERAHFAPSYYFNEYDVMKTFGLVGDKTIVLTNFYRPFQFNKIEHYLSLRSALAIGPHIHQLADMWFEQTFGRNNVPRFLCVQLRRGDYKPYCDENAYLYDIWNVKRDVTDQNCYPSIHAVKERVEQLIEENWLSTVFMATNADQGEIKWYQSSLSAWFYTLDPSTMLSYADRHDKNLVVLLEQAICSRASIFLGNVFSTVTLQIMEERQVFGLGTDSTRFFGA